METAPQKPEAASADQHREEEQSCVVLGVIVAPGLARDVTAKIAAELGDDLRALNTGVDWRTELTVLPLTWQVETARSHESNYVAPASGRCSYSRLHAYERGDGYGL